MGRLSGRTAIVTGGAKGIGRHYSLALAADGARFRARIEAFAIERGWMLAAGDDVRAQPAAGAGA